MDTSNLIALLEPYAPWWKSPAGSWRAELPDYERPVVHKILADLKELPQMISLTGPRRVGKTTALKQVIARLIDREGIPPSAILYFSFDDPALFADQGIQQTIFDALVELAERYRSDTAPQAYLFLDEIQRLPRWELFLKKYYDLKRPVRFIVSGSASSPIFRSTQESLLGRIKDRHLLPFGFKEFCQYQFRGDGGFRDRLKTAVPLRQALLDHDGPQAVSIAEAFQGSLAPFEPALGSALVAFMREGGFPEVWGLADPVRKIEYLMEQQVRKVLFEDLTSLTQYRKPENILRFFVYLLGHPGIEINTTTIAKEIGVPRQIVDDNFPRLEMTDLLFRIPKFSAKPLRVRKSNVKCYPVDLALRNAVLKTWEECTDNPQMMGRYAENLVAGEVRQWPEVLETAFYREKQTEVDFVLTHADRRYLPIEVKHRTSTDQAKGLTRFMKAYGTGFGLVVTRDRQIRFEDGMLYLPLRLFLLAC